MNALSMLRDAVNLNPPPVPPALPSAASSTPAADPSDSATDKPAEPSSAILNSQHQAAATASHTASQHQRQHPMVAMGEAGVQQGSKGRQELGLLQVQGSGREAALLREAYREMLLQQQTRHRSQLQRRQQKHRRQLEAQVHLLLRCICVVGPACIEHRPRDTAAVEIL